MEGLDDSMDAEAMLDESGQSGSLDNTTLLSEQEEEEREDEREADEEEEADNEIEESHIKDKVVKRGEWPVP